MGWIGKGSDSYYHHNSMHQSTNSFKIILTMVGRVECTGIGLYALPLRNGYRELTERNICIHIFFLLLFLILYLLNT